MTFISLIYGFFLLAVLGSYWLVKTRTQQLWVLVIASLIFYASEQIQYIPVLLVIILINFSLGKKIGVNTAPGPHAANEHLSNEAWLLAQKAWNQRRLKLLWLGILLNVVCLLSFRYLPFVLSHLVAPSNLPVSQESANWMGASLIVPLGLSFFIFECIAYLVDVYRGAPANQQLLQFSAYKLFFPKLIAGPITRYHQFAEQLKTTKFPSVERLTQGLWLIACGAIKKALLADRIAIFVDLCFGNLERAGSADLWLAIFAYGLQLYLDFSGYVDIARGSAVLLGFDLPENFDFPYFSTSIADFWRRWHMTLGDWIRNYLYFPLGGSRQGLGRTCFNLMIVMLVIGIWHGAAWGFLIWGALHGLALVVHRLTRVVSERLDWAKIWWQSILGVCVAWLLTQSMVFFSWIFFRLPSIQQAGLVIQNLWGHSADVQFAQKVYIEAIGLGRFPIALLLAALMTGMGIVYMLQRVLKLKLNWPVKLLLVPLCLLTVWVLAPQNTLPYIYFDF
ncbi:MBOAT family O-acyltransferase [Lyngbya aestuarii]|uniref:MBOAT family O-acyltransferase n=1 Tax=Lyngbya aestuarii TaxID=118322 RepID=UPI00403DEA1A